MRKMSLKKIAAFVLAGTMAIGMSATVFAETEPTTPTTYTDKSTVSIGKEYVVTNPGTTSPAETFYLVQEGEGTASESDATSAPALPTAGKLPNSEQKYVASVSYEEGDTVRKKDFTITLPDYNKVGVYKYTLKEIEGSTAGVTYRTSTMKLVVTVIEQNGLVRVAAVHTEAEGEKDKSDSFSDNTYSAGTLTVTKTVKGIMGDKDKYFPFTIKLTGVKDKQYADSYKITTTSKYTDNASSIKVGGEATVYLKDKDQLSIENLPYGVTYTVTEAGNDGYTVTNVVTDEKGANKGTIDSALETDAYTNTKGGKVDTGVIMSYAPYIAMIAVACVFAVMFFRRREDV